MSKFDRFKSLKGKHEYHRESHGQWMYRPLDSTGPWNPFHDDKHFAETVNSLLSWDVGFFTEVPNMPVPAALI